MRLLLPALAQEGIKIDAALVGEPTGMQPAIAERGLIVLDCVTQGVAGHAARNEGINAIYRAMADIDILRGFRFDRQSDILGPIKVSITQIEPASSTTPSPTHAAGWWTCAHRCLYQRGDIRDATLSPQPAHHCGAPLNRVQASVIHSSHPLVKGAVALGRTTFVSPTTSDMSLMHGIPSLKMGPGDSSRSHRADEYILVGEIEEAIGLYTSLLTNLNL